MCGIVGFVSNGRWKNEPELSWLDNIINELNTSVNQMNQGVNVDSQLKSLTERFDDLASFGLYFKLIESSDIHGKVKRIIQQLKQMQEILAREKTSGKLTEQQESLAEIVQDYLWQLEWELLGVIDRTTALFPESLSPSHRERSHHFIAWSLEQVLENLDRLEIRGRDSAGLTIQCLLSAETDLDIIFQDKLWEDFEKRQTIRHLNNGSVHMHKLPDGHVICRFIYKAANLVGRLGDNTKNLRGFIRNDRLLWTAAKYTEQINIVTHTRWASNGIISLPNCHPVDGVIEEDRDISGGVDKDVLFVLNGDVDNYSELVEEAVLPGGYSIPPPISTDVKILPVFYRLNTTPKQSPEKRFVAVMNHSEGSLAVVMQHPAHPDKLYLGLKGSGQSLLAGKVKDGLIVASELYGLCSRTRYAYALSGLDKGGTAATLSVNQDGEDQLKAHFLEVNEATEIKPEPIEIYSRDIVREPYEYYFEKEIRESVTSVQKTIRGKYRKEKNHIEFFSGKIESMDRLLGRLRNRDLKQIRRILVIGQGTAAVAAMGVAYVIAEALKKTIVSVNYIESPELSGFQYEKNMDDLLLIPVSQSGTTTDTNRTVDIIRSRGAWIHAIVNRRNSPLVKKSNSYMYTSDGRDVEMAVASTKAFYSQITAGKLLAMLLAQEFKSLSGEEIYREILAMEELPDKIEQVLSQSDIIAACAEKYAPISQNWAVVGNGPNKIAAKEIRIKLSELCYKSIPCDVTEDKKHIDLSTEPLTIVVANDLPDSLLQDTVKEVSIFKAHSGKPIVFCSKGESSFSKYAEEVIKLPQLNGKLGFVLATVAGHLWGFYAAKAIDRQSVPIQKLRSLLTGFLEKSETWNSTAVQEQFYTITELLKSGKMDAALPVSSIASLFEYKAKLESLSTADDNFKEVLRDGIFTLNQIINNTRRTIDSIRHQAKTITVGTSRPEKILASLWLNAFDELSMSLDQLMNNDIDLVRVISPILSCVEGGMLFESPAGKKLKTNSGDVTKIQISKRFGCSVGIPSTYDKPSVIRGIKRRAVRLGRAFLSPGRKQQENLLIIPLLDNVDYAINKIALFHLGFVEQTSNKRKLDILKGLGKHSDFIEMLEETRNTARKDEILEAISPRDLVYKSIQEIIKELNNSNDD